MLAASGPPQSMIVMVKSETQALQSKSRCKCVSPIQACHRLIRQRGLLHRMHATASDSVRYVVMTVTAAYIRGGWWGGANRPQGERKAGPVVTRHEQNAKCPSQMGATTMYYQQPLNGGLMLARDVIDTCARGTLLLPFALHLDMCRAALPLPSCCHALQPPGTSPWQRYACLGR